MIKSTYRNLPETKKQRLLMAAKSEFSRRPYHEASINQIIKDADISRGSFYTYFDSKDDLADALLEDYFNALQAVVSRALENSRGDIFTFFPRLYDATLIFGIETGEKQWFPNIFKEFESRREDGENCQTIHPSHEEQSKAVLQKLDFDSLSLKNEGDIKCLIDFLMQITHFAMVRSLKATADERPALKKKYLMSLEFIKYGVIK